MKSLCLFLPTVLLLLVTLPVVGRAEPPLPKPTAEPPLAKVTPATCCPCLQTGQCICLPGCCLCPACLPAPRPRVVAAPLVIYVVPPRVIAPPVCIGGQCRPAIRRP